MHRFEEHLLMVVALNRATMAILMGEDADVDADADAAVSDLGSLNHEKLMHPGDWLETEESLETSKERRSRRAGGLRRVVRSGRSLAELATTNFMMDIKVVIETFVNDGHMQGIRQQDIIIVPSKLDTGSDHNLVSFELLVEHEICDDLVIPIPPDQRIEITGLQEAFTYTPEWEVTLTWWRPTDLKRRTTKFMVVKQAPFEVLFSSESFSNELLVSQVHTARQ